MLVKGASGTSGTPQIIGLKTLEVFKHSLPVVVQHHGGRYVMLICVLLNIVKKSQTSHPYDSVR